MSNMYVLTTQTGEPVGTIYALNYSRTSDDFYWFWGPDARIIAIIRASAIQVQSGDSK